MKANTIAVNVKTFHKIANMILRLVDHIRKEKFLPEKLAREAFDQIDDLAKELLITPPRECDVGTAEEQAQRFHYFCASNQSVIDGMCQPTCPCIDCPDKCHCLMLWAQMPYEEKEEEMKRKSDESK